MHRADTVVQRELAEIGDVRSPRLRQIIDFHPCENTQLLAVDAPQTLNLAEIMRHTLALHIARRLYRQRGVGRETKVCESQAHSLAHKILHRRPSVAERRMGVKIIPSACAEFFLDIHN